MRNQYIDSCLESLLNWARSRLNFKKTVMSRLHFFQGRITKELCSKCSHKIWRHTFNSSVNMSTFTEAIWIGKFVQIIYTEYVYVFNKL